MVGTWISVDDTSTVELRVTKKKKKQTYAVIATDSYDGEIAAVSEEKYSGKTGILSFAAYWDSTGRFTRYRMILVSKDKVEITYTHIDSEVLVRKGKKPNQPLQRNASTGSVSSFESPARRG